MLREFELFDHCIDLRYQTKAKTARESIQGSSIDGLLRQQFKRDELKKARSYLEARDDEESFFTKVRDRILE